MCALMIGVLGLIMLYLKPVISHYWCRILTIASNRQSRNRQRWVASRILHNLDGGLETMLCWGPNYVCNLYWDSMWPLEVVA